jgi:hypothetical protein
VKCIFLINFVSHTKGRTRRVFKIRVLRSLFRLQREEVAGGWRRLHNEELHNLCASPNIIRVIKSMRMIWTGQVPRMEEIRNTFKTLIGKPEGKRTLGRSRRRWVDNVRIDLRKIGQKDVDWIDLTQERDLWWVFVNTKMNLRIP